MTDHEVLAIGKDAKPFLGFGAMRLPGDAEACRRMFDTYLDSGFNYFDTAYVYKGSEEMLKKALVSHHPRGVFQLANKLPPWMAHSLPRCEEILNTSLKRCGVDYFDFYLIHSLDDGNHQRAVDNGLYAWAADKKKQGRFRHVGFSFHGSAALLDRVLTDYPELEFVQLQLNYVDVLRGQAGGLHQVALKHNKPILVMEPVKGGTLTRLPAEAEAILKAHAPNRSLAWWALRYVSSLPGITCVLSGMSAQAQVEDNLTVYNPFVPLSAEEHAVLEATLTALAKVAAIPCTGCRYCVPDCPQGIDIPTCFNLYNEDKRGGSHWNLQNLYRGIPKGNRAEDCLQCGACTAHCPQHIDIPTEMAKVTRAFS